MDITNEAGDDILTAIRTHLNNGGGTAVVRIYSAAFAALLVSFDLDATPFAAPGAGASGFRQIAATTGGAEDFTKVGLAAAGAGMAAAKFRIMREGGTRAFEGNVGASGSGAEVELSNVNIAENQEVTLTSCALRIPTALGAA